MSKENVVTFTCGVYGNPNPTISWYMTIAKTEGLSRELIEPLKYPSGKVSQTGGILTLIEPDNEFDHKIDCQATNEYGTIISKQVQIVRGFLGEYIKSSRQQKVINDNTGFLLDCEPPQHYPSDSKHPMIQ